MITKYRGALCFAFLTAFLSLVYSSRAAAQSCYSSSIMSPSPFLGNNGEIFKLSDGSIWEVKYEYEYMYEYFPRVTACPSSGKLIIGKKSLNVVLISPGQTARSPKTTPRPTGQITVVASKSGCRGYFLADGPQGYYLLEWFGGHTPSVGDTIIGNLGSFGFADVFYPNKSSEGRVWVDDYLLSRSRATEKYADKCN